MMMMMWKHHPNAILVFILLMVGQLDYCPTALAFVMLRLGKLSSPCPGSLIIRLLDSPGDKDAAQYLESELEYLQQQLQYIEALEERNKALLESFVDEQDQWDSLEESERQLLSSKTAIESRIEELLSDLVNGWMGQKSMDG